MERAYWCISLFCVECGLAGYTIGVGEASIMVEEAMMLVALLYVYVVVVPQDVE